MLFEIKWIYNIFMADKENLIEFTEEERNIIRYCVEFEIERKKKEFDETCVEILTPIFNKLMKYRERELADGTNRESIFI